MVTIERILRNIVRQIDFLALQTTEIFMNDDYLAPVA